MYSRAPGIMLVTILIALIFLYLLHRTLNRLYIGKGEALLLITLMLAGGFLPSIPLGGGLALNIGGALIPAAICIYLVVKADTPEEKIRGPVTAVLTAAAIWSLDRLLLITPGAIGYELDPLYLPAVLAGLIAYIAGRSRRSAFIGGVFGILLLDLGAWIENMVRGFRNIPVVLGAAGAFDAVLIAGVFAVMLAELIGEIRERINSGP